MERIKDNIPVSANCYYVVFFCTNHSQTPRSLRQCSNDSLLESTVLFHPSAVPSSPVLQITEFSAARVRPSPGMALAVWSKLPFTLSAMYRCAQLHSCIKHMRNIMCLMHDMHCFSMLLKALKYLFWRVALENNSLWYTGPRCPRPWNCWSLMLWFFTEKSELDHAWSAAFSLLTTIKSPQQATVGDAQKSTWKWLQEMWLSWTAYFSKRV